MESKGKKDGTEPDPGPVGPFGDGLVAGKELAPGRYEIGLEVSDGPCTATNTVTVQVITAEEALLILADELVAEPVDGKLLKKLTGHVLDIGKALEKGKPEEGVKKLRKLIEELAKAKAGQIDAATAAWLAQEAQWLLDSLTAQRP